MKKSSRCSAFSIDVKCIERLNALSELLHETKTSIVELAVKRFYEETTKGQVFTNEKISLGSSEKFDVVTQVFKLDWVESIDIVTDDNIRITLNKNNDSLTDE